MATCEKKHTPLKVALAVLVAVIVFLLGYLTPALVNDEQITKVVGEETAVVGGLPKEYQSYIVTEKSSGLEYILIQNLYTQDFEVLPRCDSDGNHINVREQDPEPQDYYGN